jgi:hypothetical protein
LELFKEQQIASFFIKEQPTISSLRPSIAKDASGEELI